MNSRRGCRMDVRRIRDSDSTMWPDPLGGRGLRSILPNVSPSPVATPSMCLCARRLVVDAGEVSVPFFEGDSWVGDGADSGCGAFWVGLPKACGLVLASGDQ